MLVHVVGVGLEVLSKPIQKAKVSTKQGENEG